MAEESYDCRRLLKFVADTERVYAAEQAVAHGLHHFDHVFGHAAVPPHVHVLCCHDQVFVTAYTKHCVAAQMVSSSLSSDQDSARPLHLCTLETTTHDDDDESDEVITQLTVVVLQPGILQLDSSACNRVAVVIGTSFNRLYCVELVLEQGKVKEVTQSPTGFSLWEILPLDQEEDDDDDDIPRNKNRTAAPFLPRGGVAQLSLYGAYVWVVYGDGQMVKLHHAALFPTVWQRGSHTGQSVDQVLSCRALVRFQIMSPATMGHTLQVQPLPKFHPSPLQPLSRKELSVMQEQRTAGRPAVLGHDDNDDDDDDFYAQALVYGTDPNLPGCPTLGLYSSENQFLAGGRHVTGMKPVPATSPTSPPPTMSAVVDTTKSVVTNVLSSAVGALQWGWGARNSSRDSWKAPKDVAMDDAPALNDPLQNPGEDDDDDTVLLVEPHRSTTASPTHATTPFECLGRSPVPLWAGPEWHDTPRVLTHVCVTPRGDYAALTDQLGRVLLMDLASKQWIRMLKGFRQATCCWTTATAMPSSEIPTLPSSSLLLVIHSRQRHEVEVWDVFRGKRRLSSFSVGPDAVVLPCYGSGNDLSSCCILHSSVPGARDNYLAMVSPNLKPPVGLPVVSPVSSTPPASTVTPSREAAMRLQHLKQLLSAPDIEVGVNDIYLAVQKMESLADLGVALDLLSQAKSLETRLQVNGSDFQKRALSHGNNILQRVSGSSASAVSANPSFQLFSLKLQQHSQVRASGRVSLKIARKLRYLLLPDCLCLRCSS
jgi:Rab3 GTPase-activating protein regulatory subunit N-terminus